MANYKNILLKDAQGNALLPITLSYYVEYRDGLSVQAYLDTLGSSKVDNSDFNDFKSTLSNSLNQSLENIVTYFDSYVSKPDWASYIGFDNSSYLTNLEAIGENDFVTVQQAIESLDQQITNSYTNLRTELSNSYTDFSGRIGDLEGRVSTAESDIDTLEGKVSTLETDAAQKYDYAYSKVNELFPEGNLAIDASAVSFTPSGSTTIFGSADNVDEALDALETKVNSIDGSISEALSSAVTSVDSETPETLRVTGVGSGPYNGAIKIKLNLSNDGKLTYNNSGLTIDETKLDMTNVITYAQNIEGKIQTSQIEGGLDADNITITYSYTDINDVVHNDGEKSVQEFYDETSTTLSNLQDTINDLDANYAISMTDDGGANNSYARVYTISQGSGVSYTINIPKDQFLKSVDYAEVDEIGYSLIFTWNLPNDSDDTDTSYVPVSDLIDAITGEVSDEVTVLSGKVDTLEDKVTEIEASYITGATIDGQSVTVNANRELEFTYVALYAEGTSSEAISNAFLASHGITLS